MGDIGARFSISAHLDENSLNNISKKVQDTLKALEKNNKLKIDTTDIDKLDSAIEGLGKDAKKINLDSLIGDFLKDLEKISNEDEQVDKFRKLIFSIEELGKINIPSNVKSLTTDELKQWLDVISQIKNAKKDISDISSEGDFDSILDDLDSIDIEKIKKNGQDLLEYIELYKSLKKKYKELKSPTEDQKLAYDGWVLDFKESLAENNLAKIINKNVDDALNGKLEIKAKIKPEITNDVSPNDVKKAKEKVDETISKNSSKVKMIPDFEDFNSEVEKGLEKFSFSKGIKITPLSDSNNGSDDIPLDDVKISGEASKSEINSVDSVKEHVKELAEEIGTKKVEAINNEVAAMENAATSEIESIDKIKDTIDQLISKIQSINSTAGSPLRDVLDNISTTLTTINNLSSIPNVFNSIIKTANSSQQIDGLKIVLEAIATSLEQIDKNASGNGFLKQLSSLTAQQKQLETLLKLAQNVNAVNQVAKNINTGNNSSKNKTDQQRINEYYDERIKALRDQNKYLKKLENQNLSPDKTQKYNDLLSDAKKRERNSVRKINRLNSNVSPTGKRSERVTDLEEQIKIQKDLNNISAQDVKNKAQQDAAAKKQADDIKDLNKWYTEEISNLDQIIKLRKKLADNSLSKLDRQQTNDKIKTLTSRNAVLEKNIKKSNYTDPDAQNNLDAKKQEVRIEQVSGWYKQLISNLQRILKLKKEIDNSPNLTPFEIDQKKKEINNLQKKNPTLSRNINSAVSKDPSLFDRNSDILILDLKNEITLQKQRTAQSKVAQQQAEAEAKANQEVADSYDALIQGLRKIKSLENAKSKTDNPYEIDTYNKAIDDIDEATLRANLQKAESNKNVTGNFDAQKKVVADLEKDINRIGKLAQDKIQQASDDLQKNHAETKQILKEDEADWSRAMDLLTNNSYFKEATRDANEYYDILKSIVSIERVDERDDKTGQHSISYRFKDTEGNQLKVSADGTFEIERKQILDLADAYNIVTKAENELNVKQLKNKTESSNQIDLYNKLKDELQQIYKLTGGTNSLGKFQPQTEQETEAFQNLANAIKKTVTELGNLTAAQKGTTQTQIEKFLRKIYNWEDKNTKGTAIFKTELDGLIKETQNLGADVDLDKQIGKFVALQNAVSSQGADGLKFFDEFKKNAKLSLSNLLAQYLSLQDLIRYVQSAITQINDLDYALVDLSKTADMTEDQLNDFYMSAHNSAKELGTTTKNIIDLASSWSRLGYNTNEEATKMAELTAKFAAISPGMTTDEASTGLINIQKSWQKTLKVQDLEAEVLDKVNVLGNNFAEENSDILNGMQKAASALSAMGTSYEDAFALFTGAQEVIQDADRVGNGLKTVAMRIRGYSEDVETGSFVIDDSLKNISGKLIDLTKIAGVLPEGISVYTDETKNLPEAEKKYKSLLEYLREISKYWDKFSETQQTELLQALFAKTQASVGSAIITNFDQVEAALQAMEDSEGSADREMSKIEDSISYKINAIQQTWVGFLQQLANRDVIKGAADALLHFSEVLTSLGPGGAVAGLGLATAGIKALGKATDSNGEKIFSFGKKVRDALGVTTLQQSYMGGYADSLQGMTKKTIEASLANSQYNKTQKEQLLTMAGLTASTDVSLTKQEIATANTALAKMVTAQYVKSEEELTLAKIKQATTNGVLSKTEADLLTKKSLNISLDKKQASILDTMKSKVSGVISVWNGMSTAMKTGSVVLTAAVAAIGLYIYIKNRQKKAIEETRKAAEEALSTYKEESSTIRKTTNDIKSIKDEYYKLAKGVDSFGNNVSLSNENFERYNELSNQIADAMPELVDHWTDQGNAILTVKDNVKDLNDSLDEYSQKAAYALINGTEDDDGKKAGGAQAIIDAYQNEMNGIDGLFYKRKGLLEQKNQYKSLLNDLEKLRNYNATLSNKGIQDATLGAVFNADPSEEKEIKEIMSDLKDTGKELGLELPQYDAIANSLDSILGKFGAFEKAAISGLSDINDKINEQNSGVRELANAYLTLSKTNMSGDQRSAIQNIINNLDENTLSSLDSTDAVDTYVEDLITNITKHPEVSTAILAMLNPDKTLIIKEAKRVAEPYKKYLAEAFANGLIDQNTYRSSIESGSWAEEEQHKAGEAASKVFNSDKLSPLEIQRQLKEINSYTNQFTEEQLQDFTDWLNNTTEKFDNYQDLIKSHKAFMAKQASSDGLSNETISGTMDELDKIYSAYSSFYEKAKENKVGEELASDISDIEAFREEFSKLDNVDFGDFSSFDEIENVLTSGKSSAEEMTAAFNQLYSSYAQAKLEAGEYSKEAQQVVSTQLQQAGATKESADAFVANLVAQADARKSAADASVDLQDATLDEIVDIEQEGNVSLQTAQYLLKFAMEKIFCNDSTIVTDADIDNLIALAEQANATSAQLAILNSLKSGASASSSVLNTTGKGAGGMPTSAAKAAQDQTKKSVRETINDVVKEFNDNNKLDFKVPTSTGSKNSGGGSGSSKSDTDEYLEKYKTQYERLKKYRDDDKISEYDYLQYLRALYENYFKDKKKYAEQYEEYEHEYLEGMKTLYENVFTYLSGRIDKQISKLNDAKSKAGSAIDAQKTAATDSLKAQKKAAVDAIEAQIKAIKKQQDVIQNQVDAYQEQIDAINDANDAREREIALQKALYDLDKLQNQRTNLVYSESQGMHYEADLSGIRDARDSVDDAKNDIEIANIQKKIDLLEKQKDLLDDEIDKLEEQKDAIEDYYDNLIDETEAYYDKLKEDMEAAYDKQIELLEKQKDKFSDLKDFVDNIDIASALHRLTGEDTNQILQDLMNGNFDAIDKLISGYMDYVGKLKEGNQDFLNGMKDLAGIDVKALTDPIEATSKAFEGIDKASIDITESLDSMVSAFADLPNKIDVANLFGDNSAVTAKIKESGTKLGEEYIGNLSTFLYSDEAKSKIDIGKLFENIGSDVNMTSAAEAIGEPFIEAAKAKITELANQPATAEAIADAVKNATVTGTTTGVTTAMSSEEVSSAVSTGIDTIANTISQDGKSAESFKTLGQSLGQAIGEGLNAAFSEDSTSDSANTFVTTFCDKIKEAFAGNNIADILGVGDNNVFEQFIASLTAVIDQLGDIDTTPLVNLTSQFQDLQKAATDTASAIGGNGTTAQTMPTTGENGEANGTGNQNAAATTTGNSDSLVGAITALGSTADEVLGEGGEDGDGSGIVGQFQAMQKAVEDTAIAIGSGDSEGSGKKGGDDSGVGLIAALEAEKEVTFDEEQGLPKQIELWGQLEGGIQNCVDAVQRLIDGLSQLEEFSLSVNFAGFSVPAGAELGSEATGTVTFGGYAFADGTNVGLESDQRALVGEVGEESLVRNGRFSLIGRNGAQFMDLKKGDIIFSHSQTKQLLKTGRINGRGKTVGNHAYADGTPLNKAFKFAGQDTTASNLSKFSAMLTGFVDTTNAAIEPISKVVQSIAKSVPNVSNSTSAQNMAISIGDIHLSGVQNPDGLAQAIKSYLPGKLLQELHK